DTIVHFFFLLFIKLLILKGGRAKKSGGNNHHQLSTLLDCEDFGTQDTIKNCSAGLYLLHAQNLELEMVSIIMHFAVRVFEGTTEKDISFRSAFGHFRVLQPADFILLNIHVKVLNLLPIFSDYIISRFSWTGPCFSLFLTYEE
ncbi:hypothetical protein ACJX0J_021218, partial [Zea mays]